MFRSKPVQFLLVAAGWFVGFELALFLIVIGFMMLFTIPVIFSLGIEEYLQDIKVNIISLVTANPETVFFWRVAGVLALFQSLVLLGWKPLQQLSKAVIFSGMTTGLVAGLASWLPHRDITGALFGFFLMGGAGALATWAVFYLKAFFRRSTAR
tara:strand:- start:4902 stop:5363 length:462 start_codon:yes stop_codon:yes gene_type:complete